MRGLEDEGERRGRWEGSNVLWAGRWPGGGQGGGRGGCGECGGGFGEGG